MDIPGTEYAHTQLNIYPSMYKYKRAHRTSQTIRILYTYVHTRGASERARMSGECNGCGQEVAGEVGPEWRVSDACNSIVALGRALTSVKV